MAAAGIVHVISGNAAGRRCVQRIIASAGISVVMYDSAQAAFDAARELVSGCILLDILSTGPRGANNIQSRLSGLGVRLPVIVMAQRGDVATAVRAMKAGALDVIEVPFDDSQLRAIVDAGLGGLPVSSSRETAEAARRLAVLTARERQVLDGIIAGQPNKVIAHNLAISMRTVEVHRARLIERLGVGSIAEAIRVGVLATLLPVSGGDRAPP
jgi:two-component system response regulator FixJ